MTNRKGGGSAQYGSLPFAEAISFFRHKQSIPTERWADLWQHAHNRSFMVAGAMQADLLADLRQAVDDAIARGTSLTRFQSEFNAIAARHGWAFTGPPAWRARVIYETNVRQAYNAGREAQMAASAPHRPYALYRHGDSLQPRAHHLSWDGLVLPLDHPWWRTHTPQNGWGCKCKKFSLSEADLKRLGLKVGQAPALEPVAWVDNATGEVHQVPKGIDPGFDYRPGSLAQDNQQLRQRLQQRPPLARRLPERPQIDSVFSTVRGVDANGLDRLVSALPQESREALATFLQHSGVKTLILKQRELSAGSKAARAIAGEVAAYLYKPLAGIGRYYTSLRASRTNGFTSPAYRHVVVKAGATARLARVEMAAVLQVAEQMIKESVERTGPTTYATLNNTGTVQLHWSVSSALRTLGDDAAMLATWLHELGHQLHFQIGREAPPTQRRFTTRYSWSNKEEAFAEAFAAYLLAPEAMRQYDPLLAQWLANAIQRGIDTAKETP
ncbi:phage minor head protein [Ferrimonas balearica]|uniref:phage head morphogenesis protein n=1 Tax=Ferrimonas balearica TaxID=44012 RepID=UPI001C963A25|nr:phage minor head protein [Ferrimonas balearica]MBY6223571.1 phage head morphogenesis protein [Ferrimonas balearica]